MEITLLRHWKNEGMSSPSTFSPKFALVIAVSFCLSLPASSHSSLRFLPKFPRNISLKPFSSRSLLHSPPSDSQKLASDLLSIFGSKRDIGRVPYDEACELLSCIRFIVPPLSPSSWGMQKSSYEPRRRELTEENMMVWWPPIPVMELARLAVESAGDPGIIQGVLDPTLLQVPDVEGLKKDRCQLTRTPNAYRFANKELNSYFEFLFELVVERAPSMGINVSLNRYDFFHGHLFLASDTGRLGVLFHAREYPAYEKERFPYNLGFCQKGSNVIYDDTMNLRNILWLAPLPSNATKAWLAPGILVVLDAHPDGIIYQKLVPEYVDVMRTIYEDDFGVLVADVNYLNLGNAAPGEKIFIC